VIELTAVVAPVPQEHGLRRAAHAQVGFRVSPAQEVVGFLQVTGLELLHSAHHLASQPAAGHYAMVGRNDSQAAAPETKTRRIITA
jgi:hypothetical protein